MIVFPELSIPGYLCMDLFLDKEFIQKNKAALNKIIDASKGISVIVGFADSDENGTYNSAAIISDGKLIGVQDKTLLPDYDIFFEQRYFKSSRELKIFNLNGKKLGIEICEDMWDENYQRKVSSELIQNGAEIIINLSASPFYPGKFDERKNQIERVHKSKNVPFIYANTIGSQDGYDGQVLYDSLVFGVKEYFNHFDNSKKAFIGLSGGIDSALVAAIATDALGSSRVKGIGMPSMFSSQGSLDDAKALAENLGIDYSVIPISPAVDAYEKMFETEFQGLARDIAEENIQARIRGNILMAEANKFRGFVLSTGNKTEMALGYCTLYGDMSGGLSVISDLDKLKVYELSKYRNEISTKEVIPTSSIIKAPSAELSENQTDEAGLGAPYEILAPLVNAVVEDGLGIEVLSRKYDPKLVEDVVRRVHYNEYKRRQAAPGFKVTKKSFGIGRRIPMMHNWR